MFRTRFGVHCLSKSRIPNALGACVGRIVFLHDSADGAGLAIRRGRGLHHGGRRPLPWLPEKRAAQGTLHFGGHNFQFRHWTTHGYKSKPIILII